MRPHVAPSPWHAPCAALGCEACCAHTGKARFSESCDGSGERGPYGETPGPSRVYGTGESAED